MRLAPPLASGFLLGAALLSPRVVQAQDGTWALTNARIETVTRGTIEKGTIVIRDGLIEAVGANVTPPSDARVVDLAGRTIYPGLVDLTSSMGLPAPVAGGGGFGGGGGGGAAQRGAQGANAPRFVGLEPGRLVANEVNPQDADLRAARDVGITAALIAPTRGAFRGLSALVPMHEDSAAQKVVRSPVGLHMGFQGVAGRYPQTLLGVIAYERQQFYDAQHHAVMLDRYRAGGRGVSRPSYDPDLDALVPVVRGQLPAFFAASNENEIRRALDIAKEFSLKMTIVGATEGFRAVDALKASGRPVVVSVEFPNASAVTGWQYRGAQRRELNDSVTREAAIRRLVEGNAAALHQAGIRFALASGSLRPNEFLANVRKAIAAGLPRQAALEALTIRPAEIAGADAQLGSIETGKIANLVVSQGDLLSENPQIRMVFVDGVQYAVVAAPPGRGAGTRAAGGPTAQVGGTWAVLVSSPQGEMPTTLTLTQSGDALDGTMTSQFGTVSIADGRVQGRTVTFSMSMTVGGQAMQMSVEGEVDGNRMTGRIRTSEAGTMNFTAERRP
jgi:hypothetical protein